MWICRCGTENLTRTTQCPSCKGPEDVEVEGESLVLGWISFVLIAFAATMIGLAYKIPTLIQYGAIAFLLTLGFTGLSMARSDQKSGLGGESYLYPIKKEESPIGFWFDITFKYAAGICFIVYAVISFLFPSTFSLGY